MFKEETKKITIAIPSKEYDKNLNNCIYNIRKFYKKVEIFLLLDKKKNNISDKKIKSFFFLIIKTLDIKEILQQKNQKKNLFALLTAMHTPKKSG